VKVTIGRDKKEAVSTGFHCEQLNRQKPEGKACVQGDAYPNPRGYDPEDCEKEIESEHTKVGKKEDTCSLVETEPLAKAE
jgi:hypothetical protein